jgi:hypothetical protein
MNFFDIGHMNGGAAPQIGVEGRRAAFLDADYEKVDGFHAAHPVSLYASRKTAATVNASNRGSSETQDGRCKPDAINKLRRQG